MLKTSNADSCENPKVIQWVREVVGVISESFLAAVPVIVACLSPALLVYLDVVVLGQGCSEFGVVEIVQTLAVLVVAGAMAAIVRHRPDLRGGAWLALGFFLDVFIREQDAFLDDICHGFWIWPALMVALVAFGLAWRCRTTLTRFFVQIRTSRNFNLLTLGLSVLLIFSRIFGNKAIWSAIVGNDEYRIAKHVAEEGTELAGYAILVLWAMGFCREQLGTGPQDGAENLV